MPTTTQARISARQYWALQNPVVLPSPQQLFDQIVETLVANGLARYEHADPFRNNIPHGLFSLVPPRAASLDLDHLMSLIEVDRKKGENYLGATDVVDVVEVPVGPYLLLGVEDGGEHLGTNVAAGRSPLTVFEGIIHAVVFPEVFERNNMDLRGSRYKEGFVPYLYLRAGVALSSYWNGAGALPKCGAPFCERRRGA